MTTAPKPSNPLKYVVAGVIALLVFFGLAMVGVNSWMTPNADLVVAPEKHEVDFDAQRFVVTETEDDDTLLPPNTDDSPARETDDAESEAIATTLEMDAPPTVDLDKATRDLVGVNRTMTTVLSDEDFRAAIAKWNAPDRCARQAEDASALALALTIAPDGDVVDARPRELDNRDERRVADCLVASLPSLSFPTVDSDTPFEREATFVF